MNSSAEERVAVAIIGAGRLGRSLALRAARAGFRVLLEDVLPSNLRRAREALLRELETGTETEKKAEGPDGPANEAARSLTAGVRSQNPPRTSAPEEMNLAETNLAELNLAQVTPAETHPAQSGSAEIASTAALPIAFVSSIEDAVRTAALVIDCVPDELESKLEILWLLDRMAPPHAVFLTPTRALSIADLAACTVRPDKCVAIALAPADLEPVPAESGNLEKSSGVASSSRAASSRAAMELRITPITSSETCGLVERFWRALGFEPVFRLES
jgi:3-hydroxybutyryl-CoA dehydrogenase